MFETYALTILRDLVGEHDLDGRIFRTSGLGESYIEEMVGDALEGIPGLETGYCARLGEVDVRVTGPGATVAAADRIIRSKLAPYIITTENKELEEIVVELLKDRGATLAIAESCTGGLLANRITDVPGASQVFLEGNVTYSNEAKRRTLAVPPEMISRFGAVSEQVVAAMAEGARNRAGSTFALATTGIAGPDGGTPEKPVGTVFIGLATEGTTTEVQKLFFPMDRLSFKRITSQYALDMLRRRCS
jgi:nicotinamide-nucleotide amidase